MSARSSSLRRSLLALAVAMCAALIGGCGSSDDDDQTPDEASFCRLAVAADPVAEASAGVLRRLDQLAPDEIDDAVVVLREAAEELEDLARNSPEAIAAEYEIRFRADYVAARNEVDAFIDEECREPEKPPRPTGRETAEPDDPESDRTDPDTTDPDTDAEETLP